MIRPHGFRTGVMHCSGIALGNCYVKSAAGKRESAASLTISATWLAFCSGHASHDMVRRKALCVARFMARGEDSIG